MFQVNQIKIDGAKSNLRTPDGASIKTMLDIQNSFGEPCDISLSGTVVTISSSDVQTLTSNGAYATQNREVRGIAPISNKYSSIALGTIDLSDGTVTGSFATSPTGKAATNGYYVGLGFELHNDKTWHLVWGTPVASKGDALSVDNGPSFTSQGLIKRGVIIVQKSGAGDWNYVGDISDLKLLPLGGTGGGGTAEADYGFVTGVTGTTVTFPKEYVFGAKTPFYRSGVRMYQTDTPTLPEHYTEVNNGSESTQITLADDYPATSDEWFLSDLAKAAGAVVVSNYARAYADGTEAYQCTITNPGGKTQINFVGWSYTADKLSDFSFSGTFVKVDGKEIERDTTSNTTYYTEVVSSGMVIGLLFNKDLTAGGTANPDIRVIYMMAQSDINLLKLESDLIPDTTNTRDFGSTLRYWKDAYMTSIHNPALEKAFQPWVDVSSLIDVPNTTIVGRAQIPDLANDLGCGFGINRIMTKDLYLIQDEAGPNGESVYGVVNDSLGQIRAVGSWSAANNTYGSRLNTGSADSYVEIVFYGTGLNLLAMVQASAADWRVTIDDSAEGSDIYVGSYSGVLGGRSYSQNQPFTLVTGLTLGIHTAKLTLKDATHLNVYGFEVINENASLVKVNPGTAYVGGNQLTLASQDSLTYNSGFETGTLGTKGGHVLVYQKSDGTIAHAVQPTDASALYLTNADHSNEEIIRWYHWREFGANRADDFSTLVETNSDRAFTIDDGTTTLVGNDVRYEHTSGGVQNGTGTGNFITITFVGTGLDLRLVGDGTPFTGQVTISVDGTDKATAQNRSSVFGANRVDQVFSIASGMPYGTHTVKILNVADGVRELILDFIVYGPKKPTLPEGAIELSSYYVMADYSFDTNTGVDIVSDGVLRKSCTREFVYTGTWNTLSLNTAYPGGWEVRAVTSGAAMEYTFYGTGIEIIGQESNGNSNGTVEIDGSTDLSGFTTNHRTSVSNTSFTAATGVWDMDSGGATDSAAAVTISGLTLGVHTVKITAASSVNFYIAGMNVITPIHSPKSNLPANYQNTLPVGSCALSDLRKFTPIDDSIDTPNWAEAVGVESDPTLSGGLPYEVPVPDMQCIVKTSGNPIEIHFHTQIENTSTSFGNTFYTLVDGVSIGDKGTITIEPSSANLSSPIGVTAIHNVGAGVHLVQVSWQAGGGTAKLQLNRRNLIVKELK